MNRGKQNTKWMFYLYNSNYCLKFHKPRGIMFSVPNGWRKKDKHGFARSTGLTAGVSVLFNPAELKNYFVEFKTTKGQAVRKTKSLKKEKLTVMNIILFEVLMNLKN